MIDYSSFTGTITTIPTGVVTKGVETPDLVTSKGAMSILKVSVGKWDYWRREGKLPEPYRVYGRKYFYRLVEIEKLKKLLETE